MTTREMVEQHEQMILSPHAALAALSQGRDRPEEPCPYRTVYQRDRDRIIHCNAYRRLMHKTQVFLFPEGDHYRTRLTHTLEVSQIARTIARALRLNEDLAEAIAMGHDLGHTPFGHAGEAVLNEIAPAGYNHAVQSVRVVERLERGGRGLNLTVETRDGIRCHSSGGPTAATLEGKVVRYADKIAYMNHDIEDALRGGILTEADIPWEVKYTLGQTKSQRITALVASLVQNSAQDIQMDESTQKAYDTLRRFMFATVYTDPVAKGEESKAKDIVRRLYEYYFAHPGELPGDYRRIMEEDGQAQAVCDYISGMSDRFCITTYSNLFIPKSWSL